MATGGPQKYRGKDMASSHTGMEITDAESDALAGHLEASPDKFNVPAREKQELIEIIATTPGQVVGQ